MKMIIDFFKKHYWLFLFITVLISYGQLFLMTPWQDDQTLFFKLQHIDEPAGYFGIGPFGEGPYRYIITPFIPIYYFFGLSPVYYYLLALTAYFFAAYVVYKVFSSIVNEKAGRISGFLFAAGYVSSDSFIRLFNSVVTSISVILVTLFTLFYWKFYRTKQVRWYFIALAAFFCAIEFVRTRTHYLITLPILFELIFFVGPSLKKQFFKSLVRLVPFVYIFYLYFIEVADPRSGQIKGLVASFLAGDFSVTYGFLSSLSNLVIPDWLSGPISQGLHPRFLWVGLLGSLSIVVLLTAKRKVRVIGILLLVAWYFLSKIIFLTPALNLGPKDLIFPYLGGVLLIFSLLPLWLLKKDAKRLYLFFLLWTFFNLAAYSAYNPGHAHNTIHRYLTHSFVPFVALLGLGAVQAFKEKKTFSRALLFGIAIWGVGNLFASFLYQRNVVLTRSIPVKKFYAQLKAYVPTLQKGDLLYFDVAEDARGYFNDAFSVASMPEETAIAWRYEIDRYDIRVISEREKLLALMNAGEFTDVNDNPLSLNAIYSFFYTKDGLVSISDQLAQLIEGFSQAEDVSPGLIDNVYRFKNDYSCILAPTINLTLSVFDPKSKTPVLTENESFETSVAWDYLGQKKNFYDSAKVTTSSDWKERVSTNLIDGNPDTVWQADRVLWDKQKTFFGFDLGERRTLARFVWVNGFANNTPTAYTIEVSLDGVTWHEVATINEVKRIEGNLASEVVFDPVTARYARMVISGSLNNDSPGIAEAWVVGDEFTAYDTNELEAMIRSSEFARLRGINKVSVAWLSNSSPKWKGDYLAGIDLVVDDRKRNYRVLLPCSGTKLEAIKFDNFQFPVNFTLSGVRVDYSPIR